MSQSQPIVAPLGQEWEIFNKATSYEPAQWKDLLDGCRARIEQVRKRDIVLRLMDRAGRPLVSRGVHVVQTESDFLWGFGGWGLLNALRDGSIVQEDVQRRYHYLAELFNSVNLMHYWVEKHCGRAPVSEEYQGFPDYSNVQAGVDWALARGLVPKGHPIFWPVPKAVPQWLYKYDAPTRMKFLEVRVRTITARFRGKMKLYDAINEMLWEPHLADVEQRHWPHITPTERMIEYIEPVLRWAKEEDPDARYLLNDYGTLVGHTEEIPIQTSDGRKINRDFQARRYHELLLALKARGAAPDAVGLQGLWGWGHHDNDIATLDLLGTQTGLPVIITEFGSSSAQVEAMKKAGANAEQIMEKVGEYAENAMTTCFAHPACEGFYFWYLGEFMHNTQGYPSAFYKRLHEIIRKRWRTDETLRTDADGRLRFRGFCGQYRLRLEETGVVQSVGFHVPEPSRGEVKMDLAMPV